MPEKYPDITDIRPMSLVAWGDWDEGEHCPNSNELATGFQFGWEPPQGYGDDTGGNVFLAPLQWNK